jgi:hypothetical protein
MSLVCQLTCTAWQLTFLSNAPERQNWVGGFSPATERLALNEDFDAAQAGFRVGYDDASHFNREYKRHFGKLPMRDVEQLRELSGPQHHLLAF